jgi:hypothetical protein
MEVAAPRRRRPARPTGHDREWFEAYAAEAPSRTNRPQDRCGTYTALRVRRAGLVRDLFPWRRGHTHPGEVCRGVPIPPYVAGELVQDALIRGRLRRRGRYTTSSSLSGRSSGSCKADVHPDRRAAARVIRADSAVAAYLPSPKGTRLATCSPDVGRLDPGISQRRARDLMSICVAFGCLELFCQARSYAIFGCVGGGGAKGAISDPGSGPMFRVEPWLSTLTLASACVERGGPRSGASSNRISHRGDYVKSMAVTGLRRGTERHRATKPSQVSLVVNKVAIRGVRWP